MSIDDIMIDLGFAKVAAGRWKAARDIEPDQYKMAKAFIPDLTIFSGDEPATEKYICLVSVDGYSYPDKDDTGNFRINGDEFVILKKTTDVTFRSAECQQ